MKVSLSQVKEETGIKFGTSGIRGEAEKLTDRIVYCYTSAFIKHLRQQHDLIKGKIVIGGDLRDSTSRIMRAAVKAIIDNDLEVINGGLIPTPALIYFGMQSGLPSVMITGSHIPAERNGLKYNFSWGEVLKADEEAISSMEIEVNESLFDDNGNFRDVNWIVPSPTYDAREMYVKRYTDFFDENMLEGRKVGVYGHSSVSREILAEIITKLGGQTVKIEYSEKEFVAIDTEDINEELKKKGKEWSALYKTDTIISTDGDGDRPLISDENGIWLRPDTVGIIAAKFLGAGTVVVPISCNTALEKSGYFPKTERTKIGSPYVIEKMIESAKSGGRNVCGYEANGGFFINSKIVINERALEALPTRDAIIVILSILSLAKDKRVSDVYKTLPQRFTESSSLKGFPTEISQKIINDLTLGSAEVQKVKITKALGNDLGQIESINTLDGLRVTFTSGEIIHLRPSMNSPEFRNYTEADSQQRATELSIRTGKLIGEWMGRYQAISS